MVRIYENGNVTYLRHIFIVASGIRRCSDSIILTLRNNVNEIVCCKVM